MSDAVYLALLALIAGAVGKLWLDGKSMQDRYHLLLAEHTECKVSMAIQDGKLRLLELSVTQLEQRAQLDGHVLRQAIVMADVDGTITQWSPGAQDLFGWTAAEAVGQSVSSLIVPLEMRAQHDGALHHLKDSPLSKTYHVLDNVSALHKDGYRIPVKIDVYSELTAEGRLISAVVYPRKVMT